MDADTRQGSKSTNRNSIGRSDMSAGGFDKVRYEGNDGVLYKCRIQPETTEFEVDSTTNNVPAQPAGTTLSRISAQVGGSRRSLGIHTRMVRLQFGDTAGAAPDGYKVGGVTQIPILTQTMFALVEANDTGNYLGKVVSILGVVPEVVR